MGRVRVRLTGFRLNPTQREFIGLEERWNGFFGGWGAGKTFIGARRFLELVAMNPGCDALIVAPFWATIWRTTLREFMRACPRQLIVAISRKKRYVELVGRRRVYYGSADRAQTLDGANVGALWIDEGRYLKREGWRICDSRLRDHRARALRGIVTSTPGGAWLKEEFGSGKPRRATVHASSRENQAHLGEGTIESLESSLSSREAKVLIEGEFGLLVGAVYEEFERKTHLVDWKYDPRLRTVEFWDFGYRRPYVGWAQYVPKGHPIPGYGPSPGAWIVFDELTDENITTELLAQRARSKGYQAEEIDCDPAGDGTQAATGLSDIGILRDHRCVNARPEIRWTTDPRWRHIPNGVSLVRGMLRNARGDVGLFVAKQLAERRAKHRERAERGIVAMLEGYAYPETKDGRPVGDQPVKDGLLDHAGDGIRYFAVRRYLEAGGSLVESTQVR